VNAADRRRLTPVLGTLTVLLALLLVAMWAGLGRGAHWHDDASAAHLPGAGTPLPAPTVPPLQHFAAVWQRPLFNPDRQPDRGVAADGAAANAGDLELTGVILTPSLHLALLREKSSGRTLRVREGQAAGNGGPLLVELHPRSAVIETSGSRQPLQLIPGPAPAGAASSQDDAQPGQAPVVQPAGGQGRAMFSPAAPQGAAEAAPNGQSEAARRRALEARIMERRRRAAAQQNGGGG